MKKIKSIILSLVIMLSFGLAVLPAQSAGALDLFPNCNGSSSDSDLCKDEGSDFGTLITSVINAFLFIIGLLSVIMIIYSGLGYVLSAGNSTKTEKAKNTLTYSVIGLLVALLSGAIVNFVIGII